MPWRKLGELYFAFVIALSETGEAFISLFLSSMVQLKRRIVTKLGVLKYSHYHAPNEQNPASLYVFIFLFTSSSILQYVFL